MEARGHLLAWYDRNRRELPWRRDRDPYRVWLSEVMLQQTRVDVVLPYYERFLERFPSVDDLAAAPVDEVLGLWSGLGYYRRARQLHAAAGRIAAEGFPDTAAGWRELPGVGDYTAAAVASIAFDEVVAVLDGNVERVVARLRAVEGDPKRAATRRRLLAGATELVDPGRPGDSNQALMELGATLCTPSSPRCLLCPLAEECRARAEGDPERYPEVRKKRPPVRVRWLVAAVEAEGRRLLFRRPDDEDLLAGTWELPWVPLAEGVECAAEALAARYGGRWQLGEAVATVRHSITHRAIEVEVRRAECRSGGVVEADEVAEGPEGGWFAPEEIAELATSSLVAKIVGALSRSPESSTGSRSRRPRG